jgi:biopolymer transport protein ExbD
MAVKLASGGSSKYDLGQNSDINVTPFVDIMLVLLIVFMVAIPVATLSINLDLPPATPPPPGVKPKPPTFISLLDGGQMLIVNPDRGQQPTNLGSLGAGLLTNLGPDARTQSILIRANRTVRYGDFMAVVNQLQAEGFYKVALITEGPGATS